MKPNFCVITTSFKRPEAVLKSLASVQAQTYTSWRHIIVLDDIESDYAALKTAVAADPRVTLLENKANFGKNASVNCALEVLRTDNFSGYLIFLDDDDWLSPTCLADFAKSIIATKSPWTVSQRVEATSLVPYTKNTTGKNTIDYKKDSLLSKKFSGDATHCIDFSSTTRLSFPTTIKNAEEWLYFAELSTIHPHFVYLPLPGTISNGYGANGLTDLYHQKQEQKQNMLSVWKEIWKRKLFTPMILFYVLGRSVKVLF